MIMSVQEAFRLEGFYEVALTVFLKQQIIENNARGYCRLKRMQENADFDAL